MKNIIKSILAVTLIAGVASCTDEQDLKYVTPTAEFKILSPISGDAVGLDPATPNNPGLSMTWEDMDYGTPTSVNYTVQVDKSGDDFDTPIDLISTTNTYVTVTSEALNVAAIASELAPFSQGGLEIRIRATVGTTGSAEKFSDVITYLVTPYSTDLPKLYMPGSYQADSGYGNVWTHATAATLASEAYGNTNYEGYVYFATAQAAPTDGFKFTDAPNWDNGIWGDDGSVSGALTAGGGDNIGVSAGYYRVKANTTSLTYNLEPAQWSVTGSATSLGWPAGEGVAGQDIDMVYDPASKKWKVTLPLTGGQKIKFRANDRWTLNYGSTAADGSSLNEGGADIDVAASGTYLIELDLSNPRKYKYTLTPQ